MRGPRPYSLLIAALLAVICIVFACRAPAALPLHLAMLAGYLVCAWLAWKTKRPMIRALAVVAVLMSLYQTIAEPAFVVMGRSFDPQLARIDRLLLGGRNPALVAERFVTPAVLEACSVVYGWFIPYLWLSIMLGCVGRPDEERERFLLGLTITYTLAYLGYLFVPSRGPIEYYHFAAPLHGGRFYALVLQSVASTGGNHGAFPSLHVGASAFLCLFDLRRHLVRGMTYVPMVLLIAISTIVLRYHYVTDVLTGIAIASLAAAIALPRRARRPHARGVFASLARIGVRLFFDRLEVEGDVPMDGPLLVVSNHTNGLVDGLVITAAMPRGVSLTAKAALKKNPLLAAVMRIANVVPFHRRQDDPAEVGKNVDSFVEIRQRLADGGAVCIFPEGISHSDAKLRELKSGAARIAFDFAAAHRGLKIVPVGLHYDRKQRFRSPLFVRFGAPLDFDEWRAAHDDATPRALTGELEARIVALTANFDRVREALWLRWTAELLDSGGDDPAPLDAAPPAYARRAALLMQLRDDYAQADRDRIAALLPPLRAYRRALRRLGVEQEEVFLSMHPLRALFFVLRELELIVAGLPLFVVGAIQHGVAFALDRLLTRKLSVDLDHWASNAIFYGFAIFPLVWLIGVASVWMLAGGVWAAAYALALPFTVVYVVLYGERFVRAVRRARTFIRFALQRTTQRALQSEGRQLIAQIEAEIAQR